ncbi:glycoside hydrolase (plasmid) [Rhizobium lusitanum]|uniref:GH25 family lysozyme n=1 Tax=Rhizobium lusitanum TaxID=293958 RepID=UPI00161A4D2E|nr:GH25 family lysozyme [Rhizobium lusitanum]QND44656.1 glycoside hydrolase [Rhizobium lusitanum]
MASTISAAIVGSNVSASADDNGIDLSDDLSRGQIFKDFVVLPWLAENGGENQTLSIPAVFQFPQDVTYDCTLDAQKVCRTDTSKPRTKPMLFGVDISHYTAPSFSFSELRDKKVRFVQMKASQGLRYRDANFAAFWKRAAQFQGDQAVFRGAYHFLTADGDGKQQAEWFLSELERAGGTVNGDMAPGVDLEWDVYKSTGKADHWEGKGANFILDTVHACMERLTKATGKNPILYTGKSWFSAKTVPIDRFKELEKYPLWVFDYNPQRKLDEKPLLPDNSSKAAIWQFSDSARALGAYDGTLDSSVFYGSEGDFKNAFGIS